MKNIRSHSNQQTRRGAIMLWVVMALVVILPVLALVLDRLWIDMAKVELTTGVEAPALAAAAQLASDETLKLDQDLAFQQRLAKARELASAVAAQNRVAGLPIQLDSSPAGDIRFGKMVHNVTTSRLQFLETEIDPTTVFVIGKRTRENNNPIALFFAGFTQTGSADVIVTAKATIDNRILGLHPTEKYSVPALPLAIMKWSTDQEREDTWDLLIEQRLGLDLYSYDEQTGEVTLGADGIPEIGLRSVNLGVDPRETNVVMLDLNNAMREAKLVQQIQQGWTPEDLKYFGGELRVDEGLLPVTAGAIIAGSLPQALADRIGECFICPLYVNHVPTGSQGLGRVQLAGLVAGRVMAVHHLDGYAVEIIFQPGVKTTRTAILPERNLGTALETEVRNRYIYKLYLNQ